MNDIKFDGKQCSFYSSHNKVLQLAILYCWIITGESFFVMPTDEHRSSKAKSLPTCLHNMLHKLFQCSVSEQCTALHTIFFTSCISCYAYHSYFFNILEKE